MHQRRRLVPAHTTLRRPGVFYTPVSAVVLAPVPPPACPATAAAAATLGVRAVAGEVTHPRVARAAIRAALTRPGGDDITQMMHGRAQLYEREGLSVVVAPSSVSGEGRNGWRRCVSEGMLARRVELARLNPRRSRLRANKVCGR